MACKDCGQQPAAQQPCRTFTFPLGAGSVDIKINGEVLQADVIALRELLGLLLDVLLKTLPEVARG